MSPTYFRGEWIHDFEDEPYLFYSELDDERYEIWHIEIFKDGRMIRASRKNLEHNPSAPVSDQPIPSVEWINAQEKFRAWEITAQEFEEAWRAAGGGG
jgi:hypothetical protein